MMTINSINLIYFILISSIILSVLFFLFLEKFISIIDIYDDGNLDKRKIHIGKIPPIGGIIFYLIFLIYF